MNFGSIKPLSGAKGSRHMACDEVRPWCAMMLVRFGRGISVEFGSGSFSSSQLSPKMEFDDQMSLAVFVLMRN